MKVWENYVQTYKKDKILIKGDEDMLKQNIAKQCQ